MNPSKWLHSRLSSNSGSRHVDQTSATSLPTDQVFDANPPSDHLTVIEVFQSQGCNSCSPTNALLLSKMAEEDPNTIFLDYHVTYWDYLGWKDPFGIREADDYQRQYAHVRGTSRVYTPQVMVNGIVEGVGNSKSSLDNLIKQANYKAARGRPWLSFKETDQEIIISETSVASMSAPRQGSVMEVTYDPIPCELYIPRGENVGQVLTQRNTVKSVKYLGIWVEGQGPIQLPPRNRLDGLRRVLIVQEGGGGPILGVTRLVN